MGFASERRRAPRQPVDLEAELTLSSQALCRGIVRDLSFMGSLFLPNEPVDAARGDRGRLRFTLPGWPDWVEPEIDIRHVNTNQVLLGPQALGFSFSGLRSMEERAIALACAEYAHEIDRVYSLAGRCFVWDGQQHGRFSRFGRLIEGSRRHLLLRFGSHVSLDEGGAIGMRVGRMAVHGDIAERRQERMHCDVLVQFQGWGGDFFLLEARRRSMHVVQ